MSWIKPEKINIFQGRSKHWKTVILKSFSNSENFSQLKNNEIIINNNKYIHSDIIYNEKNLIDLQDSLFLKNRLF